MLELWDVFFDRRFLRERPRQHEFGLEDRASCLDPAVERRCHPAEGWMPKLPLHIGDDLAGTKETV
jgi:hypothetical protein